MDQGDEYEVVYITFKFGIQKVKVGVGVTSQVFIKFWIKKIYFICVD
jgi:hypothetical protein